MLPMRILSHSAYWQSRQAALGRFTHPPYNHASTPTPMNALAPFLSVDRSCEKTVHWLRRRLSPRGLRLLQTFDLHAARLAVADCPCPHHGTMDCDCQMVVLLVYFEAAAPATLVLHSHGGSTWISLINTPAQQADAPIRTALEQALQVNLSQDGL